MKKTTEEFIQDAYCKHGDKYNYKLVDYKNSSTKVKIICPIHGIFEQRANNHLGGRGCFKCGYISSSKLQRKSKNDFIKKSNKIHDNKYDYSLIDYKNSSTKVKIVCPVHGTFEQTPNHHLRGQGCKKCGYDNITDLLSLSTEEFIERSKKIHGSKYDYSLVKYKNTRTKIKIICPIHGIFEQTPGNHLNGKGCKKCVIVKANKYELYADRLLGVECRRNKEDNNILEVKCMYCGKWYIPSIKSVQYKINAIEGKSRGELNLYCSDECKKACPTFNQTLYPKDFKLNTSREVQPALRKLVLKRDNYTCQKCDTTDKELHCHHYEGIEVNPVESADIDMCITLCKDCHNKIHKEDKCGIKDYKRDGCENGYTRKNNKRKT